MFVQPVSVQARECLRITYNLSSIAYQSDALFFRQHTGEISYGDALASAESGNINGTSGHLLTLESAAENSLVNNWLLDEYRNFDGPVVWLGLSDEGSEGVWHYTSGPNDGQIAEFTNWAPGEPNGGTGQNYATLHVQHVDGPGSWVDTQPTTRSTLRVM